jgi:hypothetical protein
MFFFARRIYLRLQNDKIPTRANKKSGFTIYEGLYKCNGSNVKADI